VRVRRALVVLIAVTALVAAVPALASPVHGKVSGHFASASGCLGCGDMVKYVRADMVWCAWQGKNVLIHVRFRNTSVAHITISWHPSYEIRDGGSHGDGLSSIQDSGVNAHAVRVVVAKQQPQGIPAGSPIATCKPSFFDVKSG
jgi:hypothetical protein